MVAAHGRRARRHGDDGGGDGADRNRQIRARADLQRASGNSRRAEPHRGRAFGHQCQCDGLHPGRASGNRAGRHGVLPARQDHEILFYRGDMSKNFDYIIVGAGSAGCVVAARLTEDKDVTVLLLEAGGADRGAVLRVPIAWPLAAHDQRLNWTYETDPEPQLDGRRIAIPRGKVLGGCSSINGMGYKRGHPRDYDHWRQLGLDGWGYADVLPYFKRSENSWSGAGKYHGVGGPLTVRKGGAAQLLYEPLAAAAQAAGHPICDDISGEQPEGLFVTELTVDERARRNSTARAFLYPAMKRPNLTVVTYATTTRVVIENGRAVGVEYLKDGAVEQARAAREVVLSAGAYNSPQLLMLSGIGPADELRVLGIAPLVDLPGVGGNTAGIFARTRDGLERPDIQLTCNTVGLYDRPWWPWQAAKQNYAFNCIVAVIHPESRGRVTLRSADPHDKPRIHLNIFGAEADIDT